MSFALAEAPLVTAPGPSLQSSGFYRVITSQDPGVFLVEFIGYKGGEAISGGLWTVAEGPLASVEGGVGVDVGQVTFKYGDNHWVGSPTDTMQPNIFYEGRVTVPLLKEATAPILPEEARRVQRQFGSIEIANGDGALDAVIQSYAVDGRRVKVLFGPEGGDYKDFSIVADVVGVGWEGTERSVRLRIRDQSYSLDKPLQTSLFLGSGGAEGGADLEGKPKPLAFGRVRNISPVLVDATNLIYQAHDGAMAAVDDVFDRGAALTSSATDVADYTALVAQSVSAGQYATALAVGLFKLGSSPDGLITADVRGDATPDYQNTLDTICLRIIRDRHGLSEHLISTATFAGAAAIAGELGIYISHQEAPTTSDVISRLMSSVGGWWGQGMRDRKIRAGRLIDPGPRSPNIYLDKYQILSIEPETAPVARWQQKCTYQPNWTQQRGEDLAASVTDARRQFLTETERAVAASDVTVKVRHIDALDPAPVATLYESSADADTLSAYLLALHKVDRQLFRVTVKRLGFLCDLGSIVRITYPRLGLSTGKNFVVVGIREEVTSAGRQQTTLRVWG